MKKLNCCNRLRTAILRSPRVLLYSAVFIITGREKYTKQSTDKITRIALII